jgi:hypothetical protein
VDRSKAEERLANMNQVQAFAAQNLLENLMIILGEEKFWALSMLTTGEEVLITLGKMELTQQ